MQVSVFLWEDFKMMDIGRVCVKVAGRDAGLKCVIVDKIDDKFVMVDGQTRRRKCNIRHLEATADAVSIKKNASHADVAKEFKKLGLEAFESKAKPKKEMPKQVRAFDRKQSKPAEVKESKPKKAVEKKEKV
jgi:large subunit ribosomal protein L14e